MNFSIYASLPPLNNPPGQREQQKLPQQAQNAQSIMEQSIMQTKAQQNQVQQTGIQPASAAQTGAEQVSELQNQMPNDMMGLMTMMMQMFMVLIMAILTGQKQNNQAQPAQGAQSAHSAQPAAQGHSGESKKAESTPGAKETDSVRPVSTTGNTEGLKTEGLEKATAKDGGRVIKVGKNGEFNNLKDAVKAAKDGDTIALEPGTTYSDQPIVVNKDITIMGDGGMAKITGSKNISNGKAHIVANGNVTLKNLDMSGAKVADKNGAAVRVEPGANLNVDNCRIHDNELCGIMGGGKGSNIKITNSEFFGNSRSVRWTHGVYFTDGTEKVEIAGCHFHDLHNTGAGGQTAHNIKSRAKNTIIENNVIEAGKTGSSSYAIDLPNGGNAIIRNNSIEESARSENPAMISFGAEGNKYGNSQLLVKGNKLINNGKNTIGVSNHLGNDSVTLINNDVIGKALKKLIS